MTKERELQLGGMRLVSHHGDVDIYLDEGPSVFPDVRLQRADIGDIIEFLKQARKDA